MKKLLFFSVIISLSLNIVCELDFSNSGSYYSGTVSFFDALNKALEEKDLQNKKNLQKSNERIAKLKAQEKFETGTEDDSAIFVVFWEWLVGTSRELTIKNNSNMNILVKAESKPRLESKTNIRQFVVEPKNTKVFSLQRECLLNIEFSGIDDECTTKESRTMKSRVGTCKSSTFVIDQISNKKFIVNEQ